MSPEEKRDKWVRTLEFVEASATKACAQQNMSDRRSMWTAPSLLSSRYLKNLKESSRGILNQRQIPCDMKERNDNQKVWGSRPAIHFLDCAKTKMESYPLSRPESPYHHPPECLFSQRLKTHFRNVSNLHILLEADRVESESQTVS